jgi:alkylation response protein AidB-like acyl-CoA dehydrogenase
VSSFENADDAIQIHGAYGYSDEYLVERYLRNARGTIIYQGTRELQALLQADFALSKCAIPAVLGHPST